jgi:carboxyl-terminal processing protease
VKRKIIRLILPALVLLSACQFFLGPEPDTGPSDVLKSLWNDFNNIHANLDFRMSTNQNYNSWYDVYYDKQNGYAQKINSGMSEESLFNLCADMLEELKDPHVSLFSPDYGYSNYFNGVNEYFNLDKARSYLKGNGNAVNKKIIYGTFSSDPDIGYVYISEFLYEDAEQETRENGSAIDSIINSLEKTKALVLDVRNNRGGDIYLMEYIAARFASQSKDYCKLITKKGPGPNDFSAPIIFTIKSIKKASGDIYGYTKPIVLLTNKNTVSMAEWFTLALRTQSHVTHIGTATCGAFSPRKDRFMINGWVYSISPGRVTDMNGKNYEGIGISPDKEEHIIANTANHTDNQLEEAVKIAAGVK